MKTILITGGAGFVGSSIAVGLRAHSDQYNIIALDNLKRRGSELCLQRLRDAGVEFVHGDIRMYDDLESAGDVDLVIECSAEPSVLAGYGDDSPNYVLNTNLVGTLNCLELTRRRGAGIIFLSTSRVYPMGTINSLNLREDDTRFTLTDDQPVPGASSNGLSEAFPLEGNRSLYGATKLCSELILQEYLEMYDLNGVINRCGVLTGPWQMGKVDQGVVVLWMARHIFGGQLKYIGYGGNGKQVRDILHVNDLLSLVIHQMENLESLSSRVFNVGGGTDISVSLCELTEYCQEISGRKIEIASDTQDRPADIPIYITDNARVTQATGWTPTTSVVDILTDVHAWINDRQEMLRPILS